MSIIRASLVTVVAPLILLQISCSATEPKSDEVQEQEVAAAPTEQRTPAERAKQALELFQNGEEEQAKEQLRLALEEQPRNKFAARLMEQFEVDPEEYLGQEYFEYGAQPGDTLSLIAERFLGDKLLFIVLARYNGLKHPGRLETGQMLRIPESYRSQAARQPKPEQAISSVPQARPQSPAQREVSGPAELAGEPQRGEQPDETYDAAYRLYQAGDFAGALSKIEPVFEKSTAQDGRMSRLLMDSYRAYAKQLAGEERWQEAREILKRAAAVEPGNDAVATQLATVEDKIEGQRLYAIGQAQASQGLLEKAYAAYKDATVYDPQDETYAQALASTRKKLADRYHRQAMDHYRREQLDEAKVYWRKVLEVDPENKIAPGYLSKVEEIQRRIREIEAQ